MASTNVADIVTALLAVNPADPIQRIELTMKSGAVADFDVSGDNVRTGFNTQLTANGLQVTFNLLVANPTS